MEKINGKVWKIVKIVANVLLYVVLAFCLFTLALSIMSKKDKDGAGTVFGYQFRIIQSDSMAKSEYTDVSDFKIKSLPLYAMVFIETVPADEEDAYAWYADLEEGDVLTFRYEYGRQVTITHRIVKIEENANGGFDISLEGDNKTGEHGGLVQEIDTSNETSPNYVIGKVVGKSRVIGLFTYALKTPVGITCIVIIPAAIIIVLEIIKIVGVFSAEKETKRKQQQKQQQSEIEELKRKLAELQMQNQPDSIPTELSTDENNTEEKTES